MKWIECLIVIVLVALMANAQTINDIDRWMDIIDAKADQLDVLERNGFSSKAIWTEYENDSTIIFNMKMVKDNKGPSIWAKPNDIAVNDITSYVETWYMLLCVPTAIHINGKTWRPDFKRIRIKMNGENVVLCSINKGWAFEIIHE
jgi:hypothetical protein